MTPVIRTAQAGDVQAIAALASELGYPSTADDIARRLPVLLESAEHLVIVAVEESDGVIGWLHAVLRRKLETENFVQVAALVVSTHHRSQGTGARLLESAEAWALESGVSLIRLSSNVARERAHAFYIREGYGIIKTSHQFSKRLL